MDISRYSYLWKEKKKEYAVVSTKHGYGIVNKARKSLVIIDNMKLANALAREMMKNGNEVYSNVNDAFADDPK